jgi:hypothetical protein
MYRRMTSKTLNPFCSSEHSAGSSAWSRIFEIFACPLSRLAASYLSRSYTVTLDHPQPRRAASHPVGPTVIPTIRCGSCGAHCHVGARQFANRTSCYVCHALMSRLQCGLSRTCSDIDLNPCSGCTSVRRQTPFYATSACFRTTLPAPCDSRNHWCPF